MKLSLNWIREFVDLPEELSAADLGRLLTLHTAEVEEVISQKDRYENVMVGEVQKVWKHPGAERLNLTLVDIGEAEPVQIVCGGQNLVAGMKVAVAVPGAKVDVHGEGLFEIGAVKIRGEKSHGMICAGEEIWMEPDNEPGAKGDVKIKDLSHVEAVPGTPLAEAMGFNETTLDIDNKSLTHRPDLWGHYGMAREFSAITGQALKRFSDFMEEPETGSEVDLKITIEDDAICPRFSACVISGISIEESPAWMKARLEGAGMNAHNNIVDITNYVMLELGQPMHAYDRQVVGSDELTVSGGKEGVTLVTLDETEQKLHSEDPVIYNAAGEPLILAGIKGGLKSGINEDTTEIILEAANWNPILVRKSSMRHALRTDASQRFEKGLDPSMTEVAMKRAIALIKELCPSATVISPLTTVGSWTPPNLQITLNPKSVRSKTGTDIPTPRMQEILESLDFTVEAQGEQLLVTVPSHRAGGDVSIEEDLVEEIARIHGYDNIEAALPRLPVRIPEPNFERRHKHAARRLMADQLGFTEVMNYSFYGRELMEACGLDEEAHIRVLNYLSEDQTHMRTSLVPNMLKCVARNGAEFADMRLFEIGRRYLETGDFMPQEEKMLLGAVASKDKDEVFYAAKGAAEDFLTRLHVGKFQLKPSREAAVYAHPKKSLDVLVRGKNVGQIFTVHPGVAQAFDLEHDVAFFELNFQALVAHGRNVQDFSAPPRFPGMSLDVSVLMDSRAEVATIEKAIRAADKNKLIQNVRLFDIYEGKHIPEGQKSLSFNIDLRHPERTLTDAEFQALQEAIFLALESKGGTIRGK